MLVDEIQGLPDLVVLDRGAAHRDRLLEVGLAVDRAIDRQATVRALTDALAVTFASLAGVTILAVGAQLVATDRLDGVYLALLPLAAVACFEVIGPLSQAFALQEVDSAAASRLFELTETPSATPGRADAGDAIPSAIVPADHGIEIRGLTFRYGPEEPVVFAGLDLSVPSGTSLAVVGPSGSGKSTLVNVLLRFWEYEAGDVRIGGHDLRAYPVEQLRAMLGVVAQEVHLFNGTIRDNLAVADADVTDERIVAACRMARVHDFIESLPAGYETRVGENGLLLSGGERQRIAIARAIIKDAPILILDEATANLDVATEGELMDALAPFMRGRTTIVVSHRATVAARCDASLALGQ